MSIIFETDRHSRWSYTARPRQRHRFPSRQPDDIDGSDIDLPTALARAHETISLLCDELNEARDDTDPESVSQSNFQAMRQDRDAWRDKHARMVEQRNTLEHELRGLKQALAVLAGSADE